jgi:hypothetical protein
MGEPGLGDMLRIEHGCLGIGGLMGFEGKDVSGTQNAHPIEQRTHGELDWSVLTDGQLRAVLALIGGDKARTYREAGRLCGTGLGTLYKHLHRIRQKHPELYKAVMDIRSMQLMDRHEAAVERAKQHSREFFEKGREIRLLRQLKRLGLWEERPQFVLKGPD